MNTNKKQLTPYEEYLERFAEMRGITTEEAANMAIVKSVYKQYTDPDM
jgi:hypothetical protein